MGDKYLKSTHRLPEKAHWLKLLQNNQTHENHEQLKHLTILSVNTLKFD